MNLFIYIFHSTKLIINIYLKENNERGVAKVPYFMKLCKINHMSTKKLVDPTPTHLQRKKPGSTGKGKFYHIEIRPKSEFITFRMQDVGDPGGLERLAGKRRSGSWDTVAWLVSKEVAHIDEDGHLKIDDVKARSVLKSLSEPIIHVKGDIYRAYSRKNIPKSAKLIPAMRRSEKTSTKKVQVTRKKK